MIVFPVHDTPSLEKGESDRKGENEPVFNGYVLRGSAPYEDAAESDSNVCLSSEHENDGSFDDDDLMKYIQQFDSPLEETYVSQPPGKPACDPAFSYPYMCVLQKMVRLHHDLFIVPVRENLFNGQLENHHARRNHSIALKCIDTFASLDAQQYLSPTFSFLRKLIILGVRENEENEYSKLPVSPLSNALMHSPVMAWLEDSTVKMLESVLTTHFITTDIAATARKIWSALPELFHSFGIAPQRRYLKYTEATEKLDNGTSASDSVLDSPVEVTDLLQAVEKYNEMECQQMFSFDILSIPEYLEMIPFPITLTGIRQNYEQGGYATLQQLFYDVHLMLINCFIYNPPDTEYYAHAKSLLGFLFTWMANERTQSTEQTGSYAIQFEEHIANGVILDRLGSANEMLAPKAKLMRDHVATQAIEFSKHLPREIGQLAYLNRDFTLSELPHEISQYVTQAREAALVQTISLTHPANAATNYLFSCIDLVLRYEWHVSSLKEHDQADLSHSNFLNIEGFLFDSHVVDQFPLMKHAYWCSYTKESAFDHKTEKTGGRRMASDMIRKVLKLFPQGRRLLDVNQFFKSEEA